MNARGICVWVTAAAAYLHPTFFSMAQPPPLALVEFANNVLPSPPDRLVRWFDGSGLTGTNYAAQLYYGSDPSHLQPLTNPPARFRIHGTAAPGTWSGSIRALPGISPGTQIKLQVKVWDLRHGATFEEAWSQGRFAISFLPFDYTPPVNALVPDEFYMKNFTSGIWLSCPLFPTPIIHVQPTNQTVQPGAAVTLRVVSEYACANQWFFNGMPIQNARASMLTIPNVQAANVGDYHVRVSNNSGAITSQIARISLVGQPRLSSIARSESGFIFEVPANPGETFVIETTTNLSPTSTWIPVATNTAPFWFTNSTAADRQRFYRTVFP